jgi:ATP-dependent helicase YprA (DUF1998 family)
VRALIVYPMNALINSQIDALDSLRKQNWPIWPVRYPQYTGQTREEVRAELLSNPPPILLTNDVMLEDMLLRPQGGPRQRYWAPARPSARAATMACRSMRANC